MTWRPSPLYFIWFHHKVSLTAKKFLFYQAINLFRRGKNLEVGNKGIHDLMLQDVKDVLAFYLQQQKVQSHLSRYFNRIMIAVYEMKGRELKILNRKLSLGALVKLQLLDSFGKHFIIMLLSIQIYDKASVHLF